MHTSSRSVPERTFERLTHLSSQKLESAVRVTLDIYSVQPAFRTDNERLSLEVVCLPYGRTVSRVRARETESYWEWRVSGEISKFPFNGIIKRSGERDTRRTCDHVTFGKLAKIPWGLKGKLSQWQREMMADFRRIVTNRDVGQKKNITAT